MYGGPQEPTFVQRPHHTTFSIVTPHYILKCGVPRLRTKVGTCGPPYERLRISVFATKCRRQCRSSDRSTGRRQQAPVHYTHASIYSSLSLARARVGDARSPQRTCRSARAISAFCCVLSDVEGGCFSTLRAVEMTTGALSRTCSSLRYVIDDVTLTWLHRQLTDHLIVDRTASDGCASSM